MANWKTGNWKAGNWKATAARCLPLLGWGLAASCGAVPIQITVGEATPPAAPAAPAAEITASPAAAPPDAATPGAVAQVPASDQAPPGLLTPQDIAILQQAQMPIMVPTFLPPGTVLVSVDVQPPDRFGGEYILRYQQSSTGICIAVEAAGGGFGGPVPSQSIPATLPPWAQTTPDFSPQLYWTETGEPDGGFPFPALFSDWIESDQGVFYRVNVPDGPCQFPTPDLANQVLASLRPLP